MVSKHENKIRLKYLCSINDEALSESTDFDLEIKYIDIGNVNANGEIDSITTYKFGEAPSRARRVVRKGDTIISTVRTYLQAITTIESEISNLIVSTGFAVVRPLKGVLDFRFCKYALRQSDFLAEVQKRSVGINYPAINSSDLGDIYVFVPPIEEQERIANYLDVELERIDSLIRLKQKQLQYLSEKRISYITKVITKGVNPKVKLKASGIEWLGEIPEHWEVERSKWLFRERNERSQTGEEELLTVSHLTGVTPRSEKEVYMFEAESTEGYKLSYKGDLVINTLWAWMGAMGVNKTFGIVSPAYHVYKISEKLVPGFVDAIVRLPLFASEVIRYSKGVWSSRLRLYPDGLYEIYFPVPPRYEQNEIMNYISTEMKKIDEVERFTNFTLELLKEKRTALINAVVTGQVKPF